MEGLNIFRKNLAWKIIDVFNINYDDDPFNITRCNDQTSQMNNKSGSLKCLMKGINKCLMKGINKCLWKGINIFVSQM